MRLTIAYSNIKKRNLVSINNDTHQRETLSERPIRPPLKAIKGLQAFIIDPFPNTSAPRAVALASSACVDKTTKIITEFTRKDPFLHQKQAN